MKKNRVVSIPVARKARRAMVQRRARQRKLSASGHYLILLSAQRRYLVDANSGHPVSNYIFPLIASHLGFSTPPNAEPPQIPVDTLKLRSLSMATAKQIAASRANAQKSTGPRTTAGKAASRFNALKHGIHAQSQIMFAESAEDLAELAAEYHELHSPANPDERFLVDTLVNNEWRLRRLRVVEADLWQSAVDAYLEEHTETESATTGQAFVTCGPAFERLQRIINSCERHYRNAHKDLQAAQASRGDTIATPQPEEATTTSESPASFRTNPEAAATPAAAAPQSPEFILPTAAEVAERVTASMGAL
jgi:hypothetical protein